MVLWSPLGKGLEPEVCLHPHLAHGGDRHPSRAIIQVILSRSEHLFPFDQRPSPPDTCTPPPHPPQPVFLVLGEDSPPTPMVALQGPSQTGPASLLIHGVPGL